MDHSFGGSNHQFEDSELAQAYRHHRPDYEGSGLREKLANYLHLNGEVGLYLLCFFRFVVMDSYVIGVFQRMQMFRWEVDWVVKVLSLPNAR